MSPNTKNQAKIAILEDDPTIRELLAEKLRSENFEVSAFSSAEEIRGQSERFDLYILDVLLEGERSGLEICQELKVSSPSLPILILSALAEPMDRIEGLKSGADDYLTKPFEMEELLLRVHGMLRRRTWYAELPNHEAEYRWGQCRVDFQSLEGARGKDVFSLTVKECMILKLLIQKRGHVVERAEILDKVWGYDAYPSNRTVDNFILRLRKYFEEKPGEPQYIVSIRGKGYKFTG